MRQRLAALRPISPNGFDMQRCVRLLLMWFALAHGAHSVLAQRLQFPNPVSDGSPYGYGVGPSPQVGSPPFYGAPAGAPSGGFFPSSPATPPVWDPYADPFAGGGVGAPPPNTFPTWAPGVTDTQIYPPPAASNPGGGGPLGTGGWGAANDPYYNNSGYGRGFFNQARRLMEDIGFRHAYLAGRGKGDDFQTNDFDFWVTFAIPTPVAPRHPFFITPGFSQHLWEGPLSPNDLPPQAYDAYLNVGWKPRIGDRFGVDVDFRVGVYSDYDFVNSRSVRLQGGGLGLYQWNANWQFALGAYYINRYRVKLLPAGGLIWTPDPDTRLEIIFPRPRIAHRIPNFQNTELWGYLAGEYGGGSWTVSRDGDIKDAVDYSDMRLILGLEGKTYRGVRGHVEVGYVFNRHVFFVSNHKFFDPSDTFMLRVGLAY